MHLRICCFYSLIYLHTDKHHSAPQTWERTRKLSNICREAWKAPSWQGALRRWPRMGSFWGWRRLMVSDILWHLVTSHDISWHPMTTCLLILNAWLNFWVVRQLLTWMIALSQHGEWRMQNHDIEVLSATAGVRTCFQRVMKQSSERGRKRAFKNDQHASSKAASSHSSHGPMAIQHQSGHQVIILNYIGYIYIYIIYIYISHIYIYIIYIYIYRIPIHVATRHSSSHFSGDAGDPELERMLTIQGRTCDHLWHKISPHHNPKSGWKLKYGLR